MKKILSKILATSMILQLVTPVLAESGQSATAGESTFDLANFLTTQQEITTQTLSSSTLRWSDYEAATYRENAEVRAVIHEILDQIIEPNFTEQQKVKAIYDFPIFNFTRDDTDKEVLPAEKYRTPYTPLTVAVDRGTSLLSTGQGGCQEFQQLLSRMFSSVGIPCFNTYGDYVNRNGSTLWHAFNRAKVNGTWYWYDVDVEGSVYRRGDVSWPIYYLYQQDTTSWLTNHTWDDTIVQETQALIDATTYRPVGSTFSYESPVSISICDATFNTSQPIYGYVDMDSYHWTEEIPLLPFFETMQFLGAKAFWNSETGCLEVQEGNNKYEFRVNDYRAWVNGVATPMAVPIQVINEVDYISTDDLILFFDFDLNFSESESATTITLKNGLSTMQPSGSNAPSSGTTTTPSTGTTTPSTGTTTPSTGTTTTPSTSTAGKKTATPSSVKVEVNGTEVPFGAYNIDGFNYFRLTDISYVLGGTVSQFNVGWDSDRGSIMVNTGYAHTYSGTELQANSGVTETAEQFLSPVYINGVNGNLVAYIINGASYFQLDSLKNALDLTVGWNGTTSTISLTAEAKSGSTPTITPTSSSTSSGTSSNTSSSLNTSTGSSSSSGSTPDSTYNFGFNTGSTTTTTTTTGSTTTTTITIQIG